MSDTGLRELERGVATGDRQKEELVRELVRTLGPLGALDRIKEGGDADELALVVRGIGPLEVLEHLIAEGGDADVVRSLVREIHGLTRLPTGATDAVGRGLQARRKTALVQARKIPLTHRSGQAVREAVQSLLDGCNGSRRTRTVSLSECLWDLRLATDADEFVDKGRCDHVANAYKYRSWQTATTVVRVGSRILLWAWEASASKGTRTTPWNSTGGESEREAACNMASSAHVVLSVALARKLWEVDSCQS